MSLLTLLFLLSLQSPPSAQQPLRVDPTRPAAVKPVYRQARKGEAVIEGLLQRVECPRGRPVRFTLRVKNAVERFEAPQLADVEFISHTPEFTGPMSCGGRGKGDRVRLTWKTVDKTRRAVAVEFLPQK